MDFEFICLNCEELVEAVQFTFRGPQPPEECPNCGDNDFMDIHEYMDNAAVNAADAMRADF